MKKLICVKGPPGSGKSTLIRELGWETYALSMDALRLLRRAPELDATGRLQVSQEENDGVFAEWMSLLTRRLERGEFVVLDATFADGTPQTILSLAATLGYKVACLDLSSVPADRVQEQNDGRPEHKRLSPAFVQKLHTKLINAQPWPNVTTIPWSADGAHTKAIKAWASIPLHDVSHYKNIVHIGDLQGCLTVLTGPGGPLEHGFQDDTLYIFVGDLPDRGIENGPLLRWFVDQAVPRSNVVLLWGNHEDHLFRWAMGRPHVSDEFEHKTLPQLLASGLTPHDAASICAKAVDVFLYTHHGQRVMVTHAGLPTVPTHPELISSRQYGKGTGRWSDPIDEQFERNAPSDWIQVHGHRNHGWQEIQARPRSFNLEDQVEFGGRLRWVTKTATQWITGSNMNTVYELEGASKIDRRKIAWKSGATNRMSDASLAIMRAHDGVRENALKTTPHISSFNFTKDVFFKAGWDDVVVKARGLFVNTASQEIVSRGYDKFFNINERPETQISALATTFKFPLTGYVKENGFLGNLGYDATTSSLFVATKASNSGDFSDWFRDILNATLTNGKQEGLARWLRDNDACMTFEVIDPVRDPHMIAYAVPQLILLDVFHRSETTSRLPEDELKAVANKFGFTVKQKGIFLPTPEAFAGWHDKVAHDLLWRHKGAEVEGFVFEDAKGNMTKFKSASYSFWKRMRSRKDRMSREWLKTLDAGQAKNTKIKSMPQSRQPLWDEATARADFVKKWEDNSFQEHPAARAFISWCVRQDASMWSQSIISLRSAFELTQPDPSIWTTPFIPFEASEQSTAVPAPKASSRNAP